MTWKLRSVLAQPSSIFFKSIIRHHFFSPNTFSLNSSALQEDPELYFHDPQQLLNLVTELTEQNLSLYHISTRVEDTLKDLQQSIESTKQNMWMDFKNFLLQQFFF